MYWSDILSGDYADWDEITDKLEELGYPRESLPDDYAEENALDFRSAVIGKINRYVSNNISGMCTNNYRKYQSSYVVGCISSVDDTGGLRPP